MSTYHHGNLREALLNEGLVLLSERGGNLSLRELARRVGVTANACYRHFANKEALLMALAARGFDQLRERQERAEAQAPGQRLLASGQTYLRFAHDNRALFRLMFAGLPAEGRSEALLAASQASYQALQRTVAATLAVASDDACVAGATLRAWALVHGLSQLMLDGQLAGQGSDPLAVAESALQEAMSAPRLL